MADRALRLRLRDIKARGLGRALVMRLGQAVLAAFGASLLVWLMLPLAPGDPVDMILNAQRVEEPTDQHIAALRDRFGLDRPLWQRYLVWIGGVVQGDFGLSWRTGEPVLSGLMRRLPATLQLVGLSFVISVAWSLGLALVAARWAGRWPDRLVLAYTRVLAATPSFVLALLVLQFVVVGMGIGLVLSGGAGATLIIAAAILGIDRAAGWTQLLRAGLLEHLARGPADVAKARGARPGRVLAIYALPPALLPWMTALGISLGGLIGGAPILEMIFTWPGIGEHVLTALSVRDVPVIQAFVLIAVLAYVAASLLVDAMAIMLDPRMRHARHA
ncbi:ABC transporter permease [Roseinatronobacter sp. S2]|uniref:ABC transporter permease n=1 Tax=Roseinatronobacter sp. S2 TaxID=3035471 RepID=UPI00240F724B|nr:ABC transporter permease [Roseinatronobacter sp. S2]WFE77054.1 ABC transporter permease [Roseinatronobacter sp. S2]